MTDLERAVEKGRRMGLREAANIVKQCGRDLVSHEATALHLMGLAAESQQAALTATPEPAKPLPCKTPFPHICPPLAYGFAECQGCPLDNGGSYKCRIHAQGCPAPAPSLPREDA